MVTCCSGKEDGPTSLLLSRRPVMGRQPSCSFPRPGSASSPAGYDRLPLCRSSADYIIISWLRPRLGHVLSCQSCHSSEGRWTDCSPSLALASALALPGPARGLALGRGAAVVAARRVPSPRQHVGHRRSSAAARPATTDGPGGRLSSHYIIP